MISGLSSPSHAGSGQSRVFVTGKCACSKVWVWRAQHPGRAPGLEEMLSHVTAHTLPDSSVTSPQRLCLLFFWWQQAGKQPWAVLWYIQPQLLL